jgi:hypothetical protein
MLTLPEADRRREMITMQLADGRTVQFYDFERVTLVRYRLGDWEIEHTRAQNTRAGVYIPVDGELRQVVTVGVGG